ncbi:hypothetical protein CVT26_013122 [Gymnopilus dilepis]|uniref:Uncharacterized protein n=1 Tax=Gymnopilus dilepis TaxID=231916 RepID=A0A409YF65_9AGAR|nr:hypothetical protein CVT26_013122 [Gymnopilus dilepis]
MTYAVTFAHRAHSAISPATIGVTWGDSEMRDASNAPKAIPPYTIQGPTPMRDIQRVVKKLRLVDLGHIKGGSEADRGLNGAHDTFYILAKQKFGHATAMSRH